MSPALGTPARSVFHPLSPGGLAALPPRLRPEASLGVLDVTQYFGATSGGIKTYLLEKSRYADARPWFRHLLVVPGPANRILTSEGARRYELRGPRIPGHEPYRMLIAGRSLRRIIEHEAPDLIEVGGPFLDPWLARLANRRLRAPMVYYYHSHLPRLAAPDPHGASFARHWVARQLSRYVRRLGSSFPLVLCASEYSVAMLRAIGVPRVTRVPLGVDLSRFHPARRARRDETLGALGLGGEPFALFAGRVAEEKRLDVVLEAWPEVERRTGCRLVIVGEGPAKPALRRHRHAARVTWLSWESDRDRFADLLAAATIYVAPGPAETFGLSALEAMASGTPVLSVDSGAVAELVGRSGAGATYADGSAEAAVVAAVALCESDLAAAGRRARALAERDHDWTAVFDQLCAVYRGLLAGEPRTESGAQPRPVGGNSGVAAG